MNKPSVIAAITRQLAADLQTARLAAEEARETATNKENIAENKYDTLGLEAAYLAHGQTNRVVRLEEALRQFEALVPDSEHEEITTGSLICLDDQTGLSRWYFVGPGAAGLNLELDSAVVTVITPESPLGAILMGQAEGEEVMFNENLLEVAAVS